MSMEMGGGVWVEVGVWAYLVSGLAPFYIHK